MRARSDAACDLEVNKSVAIFEFVFLEEAQGYRFELARIKARDTEFLEAEGQAVETFEEAALVGADDFVNAISEKKTAVVGGNGDLGFIEVFAVVVNKHSIRAWCLDLARSGGCPVSSNRCLFCMDGKQARF